MARIIAMLISLAILTGCAPIFNIQVLYEAHEPNSSDSRYVMRLEKEQYPVTGTKEEFPARSYNISEAQVREMMAKMYRRFFKDPATFVPPDQTFVGELIGAAVESAFNSVFKEKEKKKKKKPTPYRPELSEKGHPASMSKPKPIFNPEEIDALAPELVKAFKDLRTGEHLTLRTSAFESQGKGGTKWNESDEVTSVAIRFQPHGTFLGIEHGAEISWDFYKVQGLDFSGKGDQKFIYTTNENVVSEEYEFLVIFPRKESDTDYWRVKFPVE